MSRARIAAAVVLVVLVASGAGAQFFGGGRNRAQQNFDVSKTEFIFARWRYQSGSGWSHDYPYAEETINEVMSTATGVHVDRLSYQIIDLESDDIFKYPFAYISEPGQMYLSETEVKNFREFVDRGGFVMLDDFDNQDQFLRMKQNMDRVFPDRPIVKLRDEHPLLRTFYTIDSLYVESPYNVGAPAEFWGVVGENGDLQVVICYNNDVGDYWEHINDPSSKVRPSAEALKLGINFVLYAMTH
jgi:hypothetical protein